MVARSKVLWSKGRLGSRPLEEYFIRKAFFCHFASADIHHFFRQVDGVDTLRMQFFSQHYRLVARAGGNVQKTSGVCFTCYPDHAFTPYYVYAERQCVVKEIVMLGYVVEHVAHLLSFALVRVLIRVLR